jgi:transaldolase
MATSQLEQLASMTVLSVDTGDLDVIAEMAATGLISDATTNPLFVSQAGLSGDPRYAALVDAAVEYATMKQQGAPTQPEHEMVGLAMDKLAVKLGTEIIQKSGIKGYVSTEVDPRLSFDTKQSVRRARRIIAMYDEVGIPKERVLIKLAATWEGIMAAKELEADDITCNLTLIFGFVQAVACAQVGARLISPFTGRILDWHKLHDPASYPGGVCAAPADDPGVQVVARIYRYYKRHGHATICMPASWRPSRGATGEFDLDEIIALAGTDRMTIPPGLLQQLADSTDPIPRLLDPAAASEECEDVEEIGGGAMTESEFRLLLNADACATAKMAEGLQSFIHDTNKLEEAIRAKVQAKIKP